VVRSRLSIPLHKASRGKSDGSEERRRSIDRTAQAQAQHRATSNEKERRKMHGKPCPEEEYYICSAPRQNTERQLTIASTTCTASLHAVIFLASACIVTVTDSSAVTEVDVQCSQNECQGSLSCSLWRRRGIPGCGGVTAGSWIAPRLGKRVRAALLHFTLFYVLV
jgi:hypothetical protein